MALCSFTVEFIQVIKIFNRFLGFFLSWLLDSTWICFLLWIFEPIFLFIRTCWLSNTFLIKGFTTDFKFCWETGYKFENRTDVIPFFYSAEEFYRKTLAFRRIYHYSHSDTRSAKLRLIFTLFSLSGVIGTPLTYQ